VTALPPCPVLLRISSSPAHLPMVRSAVDKLCEMMGFDPVSAAQVVLSVDEALSNVIRHAYDQRCDQPIEVTLEPLDGAPGLRVRLRDRGQAVDPSMLQPPDTGEELTPGGLGLLIIRQNMDEVTYQPLDEGGALLTLVKRLDNPKEHPTMSYQTYKPPVREVRRQGQAAVVEVAGDIDLNRSQEFQEGLLAAMEDRPAQVVVNLSAVPFMDSSGVASLVKLLSRCRRENVPLALVGLNARVRGIFQVTKLDTVFDIFPTVQDALAI
jgi:anti-sigma B factor antagonist